MRIQPFLSSNFIQSENNKKIITSSRFSLLFSIIILLNKFYGADDLFIRWLSCEMAQIFLLLFYYFISKSTFFIMIASVIMITLKVYERHHFPLYCFSFVEIFIFARNSVYRNRFEQMQYILNPFVSNIWLYSRTTFQQL